MNEITNWPQAVTIIGIAVCAAAMMIVLIWKSF